MGFNFAMTQIDSYRGMLDLRHNVFFHDGPVHIEKFSTMVKSTAEFSG